MQLMQLQIQMYLQMESEERDKTDREKEDRTQTFSFTLLPRKTLSYVNLRGVNYTNLFILSLQCSSRISHLKLIWYIQAKVNYTSYNLCLADITVTHTESNIMQPQEV